jgi:hypothetical protein
MNPIHRLTFVLLLILSLHACDTGEPLKQSPDDITRKTISVPTRTESHDNKTQPSNQKRTNSHNMAENEKKRPKSEFRTIEWTDLIPKDDLEALLNPPSYITDIEDGSFEDQISNKIQNTLTTANDDRYQQALVSTRIVQNMDGQAVQIPGFIVPLTFNDEQTITEFFLVPFFGACIHVPPPPPNQIIFVTYPQGLKLTALYDPFWISGVLKTSLIENNVATASYSLQLQYIEEYTEK